jgi:uncharacterized protein YceH (UPF0502 family)
MEKSKTTPDGYPMSIAGLTTGCNQKSNRAPIMNLSPEQVEETVSSLRDLGAVAVIQGSGRVEKIRHYAYQWLGLSKVEAAVMTELLLRGEQTLGELRVRASRMEPIADLTELQKLLQELDSRQLIVYLSPAGRGQMVSHNLYPPAELEQLKRNVAQRISADLDEASDSASDAEPRATGRAPNNSGSAQLVQQVAELRAQVADLASRLALVEEMLK